MRLLFLAGGTYNISKESFSGVSAILLYWTILFTFGELTSLNPKCSKQIRPWSSLYMGLWPSLCLSFPRFCCFIFKSSYLRKAYFIPLTSVSGTTITLCVNAEDFSIIPSIKQKRDTL